MASQTNTHNTPQTGGQVHAHATPTEEVRLAFCCYCNSVIPHRLRPNGTQGAAFCCVCTFCSLSLLYTMAEWLFLHACLLYTSSPTSSPQLQDTLGAPSFAKLPSQIHCRDGSLLTPPPPPPRGFHRRQIMFTHATSAPKQIAET